MKRPIQLGGGLALRLDVLIHLLLTASSGGGKSNALRVILERTYGQIPHLVLDWEGEFVTLREKYDYVIVGKDGDLPLDPRSAGMFVRKLLELGFSAIVDLSEAPIPVRLEWIRVAFSELNELPREYWNDLLVALDEGHHVAPEEERKGHPSATKDLIADFASRARKRGWKLIVATQRLSKLDKDIAGECRGKLVGYHNLADDCKRASKELGRSGKDMERAIMNLQAGEFYHAGEGVEAPVRTNAGRLDLAFTKPPPKGSRARRTPPPRSHVVKILEQLGDLPQQAQAEARTLAEKDAEIARLREAVKAAPRQAPPAPRAAPVIRTKVQRVEVPVLGKRDLNRLRKAAETVSKNLDTAMRHTATQAEAVQKLTASSADAVTLLRKIAATTAEAEAPYGQVVDARVRGSNPEDWKQPLAPALRGPGMSNSLDAQLDQYATVLPPRRVSPDGLRSDDLPEGERLVLQAIAERAEGATRQQITVITGYKRSTRDAYLHRLNAKGLIETRGDRLHAAQAAHEALGAGFAPLPRGKELQAYWLRRLPEGERRIFEVVLNAHPTPLARADLERVTGFKRSTRDAYIHRLAARGVIETRGMAIVANATLFEEGP